MIDITLLNYGQWLSELDAKKMHPKDLFYSAVKSNIEFVWHPLGFAMCCLFKGKENSIRLHVWPNNKTNLQEPEWLIHDHVFDLKSWVLKGCIQNVEYITCEERAKYCVYDVSYTGNKSILKKTENYLDVKESKITEIHQGESYFVQSGKLHKSLSIDTEITITVCNTIDKLHRAPRVVGNKDGKTSYVYTRRKVLTRELDELYEKI